jgi:tRNA pseudouridine13 synthase
MKTCLKEEQNVGIETFFSKAEGIGGKLRTIPEDFKVRERFTDHEEKKEGLFTIAQITSKNWETNALVRTLSKNLKISRNRIHFAGTKDKRSVSTQLFSFYNIPVEKIQQLAVKDVFISDVYISDKKTFLGDLIGNHFDICIRNISKAITSQTISQLIVPIREVNGFPNFFGIQRFGIIRPITHLVGKKIVKAQFEEAVMTYLTFLDDHEDSSAYKARKTLAETHDFKQAFHRFPSYLTYEKALLNHLQKHPDDFVGSLKTLPKNLITMFVYAYQSYLFNRILSQRIKKKLPIHQAIEGDIIVEKHGGNPTERYFHVNGVNIEKVNKQIGKGKADVSCVLVGFHSEFARGMMGEIEHTIFEKESIDKRDFIIPLLPIASSEGLRRSIFAPLTNLSYEINDDLFHANKQVLHLRFDLQKGCYATSFLREIMKANDIRDY